MKEMKIKRTQFEIDLSNLAKRSYLIKTITLHCVAV
jgi:hypothetical protein